MEGMENIKLRFWDPDEEIMVGWEEMALTRSILEMLMSHEDDEGADHVHVAHIFAMFEDQGMAVMRYIDRQDAKGNDIYEGDIVQQGEQFRWEVVFDYADLMQMNADACEVIGNIYENPELLEEWGKKKIHE